MIPDLKIEVPEQPLGQVRRMRQKYLKEHRPILWNQMILEETLFPHLAGDRAGGAEPSGADDAGAGGGSGGDGKPESPRPMKGWA